MLKIYINIFFTQNMSVWTTVLFGCIYIYSMNIFIQDDNASLKTFMTIENHTTTKDVPQQSSTTGT